MKTSFKAVRAALMAVLVFIIAFAADAQRIQLKQLERYLGQPIPNRAGYVGLTDTLGDQYYHKLDSIIGYIADSISQGLDTDEQYFDTAMIVNDTLILSIIRDGLPAHRISLKQYTTDDQTLSYDHATNTLSISGGNSVTNFEQAWLRSPDQLHPIAHTESVLRTGPVQLGWNGTSATWDEAQLRVYNESRLDWMTFTTSKPIFGQRFFEVSELSNMLYLANKRFMASYNGTPTTDSRLFNGEFETPLALPGSSTYVVNVDFTEGLEKLTAAGITYPQGYIYINFYHVYNDYDSIKVEVVTASGTTNISSTVKNIATRPDLGYKVLRYAVPDYNYLTDIKLTFYTNAGNCWPTEIQYTQTRYNGELEEPFLNKHVDNKLHTKLTFRDKVGDRQADNGTLGQILMSKVDSVEWADFTDIPDLYEYVVNLADSVDTDTDTDEQTIDSFAITDDTLRISLSNDPNIFFVDLKTYIDTATSGYDTDSQSVSQFYLDGLDSLHIEITRGNHQSVYLGSLVPATGSDKQRFDTLWIVNDTAWYSLQRDSVNAIPLDLKPYLDNTDDQKIDVFTFVGTTLSVSNEDDGEASKTVDLSSLVDNWLLNGLDDAFGSTDIGDAETVTFDGTGGITAKLSFDGSNTMVIDGTGLQWILQAQSGTSQVIGDAASEIVEIVGAGNASTSISGNTVTITVPADVDNYVDALTFNNSTFILTAGRTGALADLTDTIMDHDWYKVGTALPPNNTEDARRDGLTGIGMNPVWLLDVAEDARIHGHQIGRGGGNSLTNLRLGVDALSSNTTGTINIAIGPYAMKTNTSGDVNIAIGDSAMYANDDGDINIAVGYKALKSNISGYALTAFGHESLKSSTTGYDNTAIGYSSQMSSTTGHHNSSLGHATLELSQTGANNIALGDYALRDDINPNDNISIGQFSLNLTSNAENNIGIGRFTLYNSTDPYYNIAIGDSAMYNISTETELEYNIAIGKNTMMNIQSVSKNNIAIGHNSFTNLDGDYNISLGNSNISSADSNVIIGYNQSLSTSGNLLLTNGTGSQFIRMLNTGFVGLGVAAPTQKLHVPGNVRVTGAYYDSNNEPGTSGQVLSSTVTGTDWVTAGGTGTVTSVDIIQPASGITATGGPITTSGSITLALANDLAALEGLAGTGIAVRTAANTWANRSITSGGGINITNGDGVAGNIVLTVPAQAVNLNRGPSGGFYGVYPTSGTGVGIHGANGLTVAVYGGNSTDITVKTEGELLALDGFSATGMVAHTAANTWVGRTITAGTGTTVVNGDGVTGNPTISSTSGFNGVGTGGPTSSTITSNTTGSNAVTINVAGTLSISESPSSNGGSITITGTGGSGTVTSVGLTGTTGIGVTGSPITTSGTFVLSLNNDLQALEGLAGTGIAVRTGAATWTNRTMSSSGSGISVVNGNGVSGDPTYSLSSSLQNFSAISGTGLAYSFGSGSWVSMSFGSIPIGGTVNSVLTIGTSNTPSWDTNLTFNQTTNTLTTDNVVATSSNVTFSGIPTYATDAAAGSGGLGSGRVYRTAGGELRIKL